MGFVSDYFAKKRAIKEIGEENYNRTVDDIVNRVVDMYDNTNSYEKIYINEYLKELGDKCITSKVAKLLELLSVSGIGYSAIQLMISDPEPDNLKKMFLLLPTTLVASLIIDGVSGSKLDTNVNFLSRYLKNHIDDADMRKLRDYIIENPNISDMKYLEMEKTGDGRVNDIEMSEATLNSCYKTVARELI